jgi:hypothetical protein
VLVAAVAALVTLEAEPVALRTIAALPLLLFLPGYAVTSALFAPRRLDWARRILLALALSFAATILGALVLDLTSYGIRAESVAILLLAVTVAGAAVGAARGGVERPELTLPRVRRVHVALIGVAVLAVAAAVALAKTPLPAKNAVGYTALWLHPVAGRAQPAVRVGVESAELEPRRYRLRIWVGPERALERSFRLEPGASWTRIVPVARTLRSDETIQAVLFPEGRPGETYRFVRISADALSRR